MNYPNFAHLSRSHNSSYLLMQCPCCSLFLGRPAAAPQDQQVYSLHVSASSHVARPACLSCGHVANCSFVEADFSPSGHFW